MNRIEKVAEATHWKDRAAGWCKWRIYITKCFGCGTEDTSYTLNGTREDAEKFAADPSHDYCEQCS